MLGLASHWAKKKKVVVYGNFSMDPAQWPPQDQSHNGDVNEGSSGDSMRSRCGCNGLIGGSRGAFHENVEFCHVNTFNGSIRYANTLILWRAFNAFYKPLFDNNIQVTLLPYIFIALFEKKNIKILK